MIHRKAYRFKLYPNVAQAELLARSAGCCRWLWNTLLAMQVKRYEADGTFVFFHDMSKMLPGLKAEHPWLAEAPSNALVRVARNLDRALRDAFKGAAARKSFPRFKVKNRTKDAFYVIGQAVRIEGTRVVLPKIGPVRFRAGRRPEGRILGGTVSRTAGEWFVTLQCEIETDVAPVVPIAETLIGVDLGVGADNLMVRSDGVRVKAPRALRAAQKRLARAQRVLSRRKKGSANRRRQATRVARLHARVANVRSDVSHKATCALVDAASAICLETLHLKGMVRNVRLALSISDAALGETTRRIGYKAEWAGKAVHRVDRFEPTTQTCSTCLGRRTGDNRLTLSTRTFRCDRCGSVLDRDENASLNLRRLGIAALCAAASVANDGPLEPSNDVGRVTPERDGLRGPSDACGDPSAGPATPVVGRRGSLKQEVGLGCEGRAA